MRDQLILRFARTNALFVDLVSVLSAEQVRSKLPGLSSNTVGEQYWCVVGARTSYLAAAKAGVWSGFSCPLSPADVRSSEPVVAALNASYADLEAFLLEVEPENSALDFLLDLLEHETQHHGQLIRYIYGLGIEVPPSWKERYALD